MRRSKIGLKCQTLEVLKTPSLFPQLGCSLFFYWFKSARSWSLRRPRTQLLSKMKSSFAGMGEHLNNNKLYRQCTSCCGDAVQQQESKFRCSKLVEIYPGRTFCCSFLQNESWKLLNKEYEYLFQFWSLRFFIFNKCAYYKNIGTY